MTSNGVIPCHAANPTTWHRMSLHRGCQHCEIERLRAALGRLTNGYKYPAEVCQIAREALSGDSPSVGEMPRCNCAEGECHGPDVAQAYGHLCKAECPVETTVADWELNWELMELAGQYDQGPGSTYEFDQETMLRLLKHARNFRGESAQETPCSAHDWQKLPDGRTACVECGAEKAKVPLRDSDAAFNLGVLPTEQPENGLAESRK